MTANNRALNDYECMLATSTCNVGLEISLPSDTNEQVLRQAWQRCKVSFRLLQVRLVALEEMGTLGPRYRTASIDEFRGGDLILRRQAQQPCKEHLLRDLQRIGTSALDISKASYYVECHVHQPIDDDEAMRVRVLISLTHALSDGPGALQLANTFLRHLQSCLDVNSRDQGNIQTQPLIDLQAQILEENYAADQEPKQVYVDLNSYQAKLKNSAKWSSNIDYLPPEATQRLPSDPALETGTIDCVHFSLTQAETEGLRLGCRKAGATIQGALSIASLRSRITMLKMTQSRIEAAIQVPINSRRLLDQSADQSTCLCGSAGIVHSIDVDMCQPPLALAKQCTQLTHSGATEQPREWLRRLMNEPASLPPYSLMVSSIGVAPVADTYGSVRVDDCLFFGGALHASPDAQSTMVHAVTFRGRLQVVLNFISPGVQRAFMEETAKLIKEELIAMTEFR